MSLALEREGTDPQGVLVKTHGKFGGMEDLVFLGKYEISIKDFLIATHYVLTNTDIYEGDPREQFVESMKAMKLVEGYNRGHQRFQTDISPVKD